MVNELTDAQKRNQSFERHMRIEESGLGEYWGTLPFGADDFQKEALEDLATGQSVLVCAPTGAGKTVVGEGAAFLALQQGKRVFYTTPIKALSNQKYHDFGKRFGTENVGLLTGDTSINGEAPIVVMTTEVLRNMIYAGANLDQLGTVVLDEVHYLSDRFRGPVWEEVLIQLPRHTKVVALSATVSNHEQFGDWIRSVRGETEVITSYDRPVPLYQHMMVGPRLMDLFKEPGKALNPALEEAMAPDYRGRTPRIPRISRTRVIEILNQKGLLPAITFIFSRAGCEEAAAEVGEADLHLTTKEEQDQIDEATKAALLTVPKADHGALKLDQWARSLRSGVAAHHAGMLPVMKETVEKLFAKGLLKAVFATETLALGINMPARTVVLESLEKWDGTEHVQLSAREYTQLTGRAGRRGIDVEGNAVVLADRFVTPQEVAELASKRSYPLKSAFFPSYNMAVNLLARSDMATARAMLESSFAQYQADASVVKLAQRLQQTEAELETVSAELSCSRGDAREYFELREQISGLEKKAEASRRKAARQAQLKLLARLRPGEVVSYRRGRKLKRAVVLSGADRGRGAPLVSALDENGKFRRLGPREAESDLQVLGRIRIDNSGLHRSKDRHRVAGELRDFRARPKAGKQTGPFDPQAQRYMEEADVLRQEMRDHPVHACPDRESHAALGHAYVRLTKQQQSLAEEISSRTARLVTEFDQVCAVLRQLGFLDGEEVTDRGQLLRKVYGEKDLVVAEALNRGAWEGLDAAELAAIVSTVVYEPRSEGEGPAKPAPTSALASAWDQTQEAAKAIKAAEAKQGLDRTQPLSADLVQMTYDWASGSSLAQVLEDSEMSGGDFVRWMRQVLDMLQQLRRAPNSPVAPVARAAYDRVLHGVVAWNDDL